MKKCIAILALFLHFSAQAQLSSYNFSQGLQGYTAITGGAVLWSGAGIDDDLPINVSIPSFNFNGINYTSCYISTNGFITFGGEPSSVEYKPISSSVSTYSGAICAFAWDLVSATATGSLPEVRYKQVNDEFIIQWQDFKRNTISTIERISFQIKLNTLTNEIKIVYGGSIMPTNSTTYPQVGLRGINNTSFRNRKVIATTGNWLNSTEGTLNNDNCYFNSTNSGTVPLYGLTFIWTAPCFNASIPYSINFDDVVPFAVPSCTSIIDLNGANTWNVETAPTDTICFNGNVLAYNYDSDDIADDWFFTKGVSLTAGSTYTLQYVFGAYDIDYPEKLEVKFGLNPTDLAMTNTIALHNSIETRFEQAEVNFTPTATGVYYLGFHANSDADMYNLYLDDILLSNATPCLKPNNVFAYNFTTTSAVISFTAGGSETEWQIEYGEAPYAFSGSAMATYTSNLFTLNGLNPGTKYQLKVRANCGSNKSLWTRLINFTTPCTPLTALPLAENFNNQLFPSCWSTSLISGSVDWKIKNFDVGIPAPKSGTNFIGKSNSDSETLLISPPLNLASLGASPVQINVWLYRSSTSDASDKITFFANNSNSLIGAVQLGQIYTNISTVPVVATDGWYNYKVTIPTSYNTNGTFYVIAQGITNGGFSSNALGIDEYRLELVSSLDIQANVFVNPASTGCYSASENVSVVVENVGNTIINFATNNLTIHANVTGTSTTTFTTIINTGTLAAGALATYTIGNANLSQAGNYFFSGNVTLAGELSTSNNSFASEIREKFVTNTLPYSETFNSYTSMADAPTWNGQGDWLVANALGVAGTKSYLTRVNSSTNQSGTTSKFNLGTVTSATTLTLDYRIVNYHNLASAPTEATTLTSNDFVTIALSTDCGNNFNSIYTIDDLNHTTSLNYSNLKIPIAAYAGQNVQIKITANADIMGSNDFYFSIDNFNVTQPLDNNTLVTNLVSSQGTLVPTFVSSVTNYSVTLPLGSSGVGNLTPTLASSLSTVIANTTASNVAGTPPTNVASVVVMAQTGATNTYTVTYNVITLNANSSLTALTTSVGTLTPSFAPGIYNYYVNLPASSTGVANITPTLATTLSTITSNVSATDVSGTAPANVATVIVTAENGSTSTYTVTYSTVPLNANSSLATLTPSVGDLLPIFNPATYTYTVTLPFGVSGSANLSATLASSLSVISSNSSASNITATNGIDNVASIVVLAQDGSTSTYTVTFNVDLPNTNSNLSMLATSVGTLSPSFNSSLFNYTVTLAIGSSGAASLSPTLATTLSTITANVSASNVSASAPNNIAYVVVTAQSGATSTYTVTYSVLQPSSDASLSSLATDIGTLTPVFSASTYNYTVLLPAGSSGVSLVTAMSTSSFASLTITQATDVAGSSPQNTATVVILAQDGTTSLTYTITYSIETGYAEINTENSMFSVYPNPTLESVFIKIENNFNWDEIVVHNINGQVVISLNNNNLSLDNLIKIDVNSIEAGIYFVTIKNKDNYQKVKLIKN